MSGLCTLIRSCPFFTLSSRRVRISTTRPLASEMTGTSRAISGFTEPVTFNCAGASIRFAVINENCSGFSTVTMPALLVSVTFGGGAAPSAGLNFFSHAVGRRHTARYPAVVKKHLLVLIGWSFPRDLWNGVGNCYRHIRLVVIGCSEHFHFCSARSSSGGKRFFLRKSHVGSGCSVCTKIENAVGARRKMPSYSAAGRRTVIIKIKDMQ